VKTSAEWSQLMAADEDTEDAVRRILKERAPEDLPSGAEARLRRRLDKESRDKESREKESRARARKKTSKPKRKTAR